MINYNRLTSIKYTEFYNKIALMNVLVYEDLHRFAEEEIPYECSADCIVSPKDKYHCEYFGACKKVATRIAEIWQHKLRAFDLNEADKVALDQIVNSIKDANDFIELVWAGMELHRNVSPFIKR
jgi:hypothetical protein